MLTPSERKEKIWSVVRVSSGNFLEMYDFAVFGYYAAAIGKTFFPSGNEFASLMSSLMTFGVGFLMRPLGAIVLGAYTDHHGRRKGLILTLGLMSLGIISIACVPGYSTLGLLAPILVVTGRLLQGFSAGMELGGVSVYLSEIATPGHKGFYCCWQSMGQIMSVILAASLGMLLNGILPPAQMMQWGWRIPLLVGCVIIPFLFRLRKSLQETDEFKARKVHPSLSQILTTLTANWRIVLIGMMLVSMSSVCFYFLTAYTPTFGRMLNLPPLYGFIATLCIAFLSLCLIPTAAAISDRIGRKPILIVCSILMILTPYVTLGWLAAAPSFPRMLAAELWLTCPYACYNGVMIVFLTEIMPLEVRTAGFSLAWSLATAVFGGFTPAIATFMIHITNNRAIPSVWLCFVAFLDLRRRCWPSPMSNSGLKRLRLMRLLSPSLRWRDRLWTES